MKIRPLGVISDFVVEEFPGLLVQPSSRLVEVCATLVADFPLASIEALSSESRAIARLDLKLLETGIVNSGVRPHLVPPPRLVELVDAISDGELAGLTYEDLILSNPSDDPRTFSGGEAKESEAWFYREHLEIENHLEHAIKRVRIAMSDMAHATIALNGVDTDLNSVLQKTHVLRNIRQDHFGEFRSFLEEHPIRKTTAPSGKFTARIPILEVMLHGDSLPEQYYQYLTKWWEYFPKTCRTDLARAIDMARSKRTFCALWRKEKQDLFLRERIQIVGSFLDRFRSVHYGTVGIVLPDAIRGDIPGTGGELNVGEFLLDRIAMTRFNKGETQ